MLVEVRANRFPIRRASHFGAHRLDRALIGSNPDQDLNALWWSFAEKYQGMKKPDGRNVSDYASKVHIVTAPCYYHNYEMGELFAC